MKINDAKIRESIKDNIKEERVINRSSAFSDPNRTEITYIDINKLVPYKKQARRIFNEESINSLAKTIKEHGIRQPLTVLRSNSDVISFEVVSGERRYRSAKQIGLKKIPCIIIDDADKAEEIALVENIQRKDLHPIELARSLKSLAESRGWGGQKELSNKMGLSNSQLSELLKITTLDEGVLDFALASNFRGRDNFRKLHALKTMKDQMDFVKSFVDNTDVNKREDKKKQITESVLRISFCGDTFKVQKSKLKFLSNEQKGYLKNVLVSVLDDLCKNDSN